jgi:hypothetical protein
LLHRRIDQPGGTLDAGERCVCLLRQRANTALPDPSFCPETVPRQQQDRLGHRRTKPLGNRLQIVSAKANGSAAKPRL